MSIRLSRMMELVSQAEKEGVTLAAMVTREMSVEEMELAQDVLAAHLSENYAKIEKFMAEVTMPSMEELLSKRNELSSQIDLEPLNVLSDEE
jgi:lambda repressor-like predicted transcriptional regulator